MPMTSTLKGGIGNMIVAGDRVAARMTRKQRRALIGGGLTQAETAEIEAVAEDGGMKIGDEIAAISAGTGIGPVLAPLAAVVAKAKDKGGKEEKKPAKAAPSDKPATKKGGKKK